MKNFEEQKLVDKIRQNQDYLGVVYKQCKLYSIKFMKNLTNNKINDYELEDVFHDAVIILYEKIIGGNFQLTASIQTYINSVCRFQLFKKLEKDNKIADFQDNFENDSESNNPINLQTTDDLEDIQYEDESKFTAIENALLKIKEAGGNCYELLTLFWYHKKSMNELTAVFGYTNADTTKTQKSKCQKRLEKIAFNELKG